MRVIIATVKNAMKKIVLVTELFFQLQARLRTSACIYLPKAVLEPGTRRSAARCLNHSDTQCSKYENKTKI